jgi:transposase
LLRMGRLPEAWIAPAEIRELREITRYRHQLVKARTSYKDQVHGVLAKLGVPVSHSDIFGVHGQAWLDELPMPQPYAGKVASLRQLAGELSAEIALLDAVLADLLAGHEGYAAIRALPGIGPVLAAVIVAEIGDIRRFPGPGQLASWAGLTPRHYESDTKVIRGHVTKQGSRMLRWAVTEAIQRQPAGSRPRQVKDAIIARRGKEARNIAKIAAARELLTLIYYGMRDGRIRRLTAPQRPAA